LTTRTPGPLQPWQLQASVSLMPYNHRLQNPSFIESCYSNETGAMVRFKCAESQRLHNN
jgi:hypothetical protein